MDVWRFFFTCLKDGQIINGMVDVRAVLFGGKEPSAKNLDNIEPVVARKFDVTDVFIHEFKPARAEKTALYLGQAQEV
jgi:hypothetical protein